MPYPFTDPASDQLNVLHCGQTPEFVQMAGLTTSAATGTTTVVPATSVPAGASIIVLSLIISSNGAVVANLQSSVTTTVTTGNFYLGSTSQINAQLGSLGIFQCAPGEGLVWNQTGAFAVGLTISWALFRPATP